MKLKILHSLVLIVLIFTGCANQSHLPVSQKEIFSPPGTVKVSDNFYCDQSEISNQSWREYTFWMKHKFGESSQHYSESLPDTIHWNPSTNYDAPEGFNRFLHPAYNYYPVVGITKEQVTNYTQWRTERVIEMLLINDEMLTSTHLDTVDLNTWLQSDAEIKKKLVPVYRIPTQKEVSFIQKNYKNLKNEYQEHLGSPHSHKSCSVYCSCIHELNSNADEYLHEGTVGNIVEEYKIESKIDINIGENAWTSFRNVCSWVTVAEFLQSNK